MEFFDILECAVSQTQLSSQHPSLGFDHCLPSLCPSKTVLMVLSLLPASLSALECQQDEQLLPLCSCFSSVILSPSFVGVSALIPKLRGSGSCLTQELQCQHSTRDLARSLYR